MSEHEAGGHLFDADEFKEYIHQALASGQAPAKIIRDCFRSLYTRKKDANEE